MGAELGILPHVGNVRSHLGCKGVGSRWLTVPKDKWVLHLAGRRVAASPIDEGRVCVFDRGLPLYIRNRSVVASSGDLTLGFGHVNQLRESVI